MYWFSTLVIVWLGAATAQHHKRIGQHIIAPGKEQNSNFEVWFLLNAYCFCTIVSQTMISQIPCVCISCVQLFATPWTVAHQAPTSMGFSRQEYWSGLPFASPGDLPNPGIEPRSPALQADALTSGPPGKPQLSTERLPKTQLHMRQTLRSVTSKWGLGREVFMLHLKYI